MVWLVEEEGTEDASTLGGELEVEALAAIGGGTKSVILDGRRSEAANTLLLLRLRANNRGSMKECWEGWESSKTTFDSAA